VSVDGLKTNWEVSRILPGGGIKLPFRELSRLREPREKSSSPCARGLRAAAIGQAGAAGTHCGPAGASAAPPRHALLAAQTVVLFAV
jgi:hypothetical protein